MDHHHMRTRCPLPRWSPGGISTWLISHTETPFLGSEHHVLAGQHGNVHFPHSMLVPCEKMSFSVTWPAVDEQWSISLVHFCIHFIAYRYNLLILQNIVYLALLALPCIPFKISTLTGHSNWADDFRCVVCFNWLSIMWYSEQRGFAFWKKNEWLWQFFGLLSGPRQYDCLFVVSDVAWVSHFECKRSPTLFSLWWGRPLAASTIFFSFHNWGLAAHLTSSGNQVLVLFELLLSN